MTTTTRIIDTTNRTEIKGRVRFVSRWTANATDCPAVLTDAEAAELDGGTSRAALIEALRNAERVAEADGHRGHTTVYVRDDGCPDAEGAWWSAEIAE